MDRKFSHRCQVCRHDERWRIELLRAGGASLDSLAAKFGLHRDAIHRHWNGHVSAELKSKYLAGPAALEQLAVKAADSGASVLDNLNAIRVVLMGHLASVTEAGDGRAAAYIAGRLTHTLETIARVSGELGDLARTSNTTYNIATVTNVELLAVHPAFARIQATMLRALAEHPAARASVVAALRDLDGNNAQAPSAAKVIEHAAA